MPEDPRPYQSVDPSGLRDVDDLNLLSLGGAWLFRLLPLRVGRTAEIDQLPLCGRIEQRLGRERADVQCGDLRHRKIVGRADRYA